MERGWRVFRMKTETGHGDTLWGIIDGFNCKSKKRVIITLNGIVEPVRKKKDVQSNYKMIFAVNNSSLLFHHLSLHQLLLLSSFLPFFKHEKWHEWNLPWTISSKLLLPQLRSFHLKSNLNQCLELIRWHLEVIPSLWKKQSMTWGLPPDSTSTLLQFHLTLSFLSLSLSISFHFSLYFFPFLILSDSLSLFPLPSPS